MSTRYQAYSTHDLQHCYFSLDVLCGQALSYDVDALRVREDVSAALWVVHQSFNAANQGRVDLGFCGIVVHALQEIQDTRQAIQIDETCYKPERRPGQIYISLMSGVKLYVFENVASIFLYYNLTIFT